MNKSIWNKEENAKKREAWEAHQKKIADEAANENRDETERKKR